MKSKIQHIAILLAVLLSSCGREESITVPATSKNNIPNVNNKTSHSPATNSSHTLSPILDTVQSSEKAMRAKLERILAQRESDNYEAASSEFGDLLLEIKCVGRPLMDIKKQLGSPDFENETSISYRFEAGFGGWVWVLEHDGTKIVSINRVGSN